MKRKDYAKELQKLMPFQMAEKHIKDARSGASPNYWRMLKKRLKEKDIQKACKLFLELIKKSKKK